jgi:hypothetical protein
MKHRGLFLSLLLLTATFTPPVSAQWGSPFQLQTPPGPTPPPDFVEVKRPEEAAERFFRALKDWEFKEAYHLLSANSQRQLVRSILDQIQRGQLRSRGSADLQVTRSLATGKEDSVVDEIVFRFWKSLRADLEPFDWDSLNYVLIEQTNPVSAIVRPQAKTASTKPYVFVARLIPRTRFPSQIETMRIQCLLETGGWKVDYTRTVESLQPMDWRDLRR